VGEGYGSGGAASILLALPNDITCCHSESRKIRDEESLIYSRKTVLISYARYFYTYFFRQATGKPGYLQAFYTGEWWVKEKLRK